LLIDLPAIAEAFADRFDEFPAIYEGRNDYRYLVSTGRLVSAALVVGQLVEVGSIVLFSLDIDEF
jgi:hypothetical protein